MTRQVLNRLVGGELKFDWVLLILASVLSLLGIAFLASASSIFSNNIYRSEIYLLIRQSVLGLWFGFVCAFILSRIDYRQLYHWRRTLLFLSFILLVYLAVAEILSKFHLIASPEHLKIGPIHPNHSKGGTRWIVVGNLGFQPVEFTKFALLVYISSFFYNRKDPRTLKKNEPPQEVITFISLKKELYAVLSTLILIILQPDLGSALLVFSVCFGTLFLSGVPKKILFSTIIGIVFFSLITFIPAFDTNGVNKNYRYDRVVTYINNVVKGESDNRGIDYQVAQVEKAIKNGEIWGEGYGNSYYKRLGQIPEAHTDAIIGVIGEEMGFIWTTGFICLYLALCIRGLQIAGRCNDLFGKSLASGITFWIAGQALLNLMSFLELTPLSGVPLPFVSYGSTSLLINISMMGLLLNISNHALNKNEQKNANTNLKLKLRNRARA